MNSAADRDDQHDHRAHPRHPGCLRPGVKPIQKWRDVLLFFISTKFLPVVASILPLWIIAREFDLLNTRLVLSSCTRR